MKIQFFCDQFLCRFIGFVSRLDALTCYATYTLIKSPLRPTECSNTMVYWVLVYQRLHVNNTVRYTLIKSPLRPTECNNTMVRWVLVLNSKKMSPLVISIWKGGRMSAASAFLNLDSFRVIRIDFRVFNKLSHYIFFIF